MTIKIVDATKIRNSIDTDFSGVGTHGDYPYIPLGEMWIDKYLKDEKPLFVALWKLERSMRGKSFRLIRDKAKKSFAHPKSAKLKIIKTARKGAYTLKYLDGATVRTGFDPYFLLGGHDLAYTYIPKNELWIDMRCHPEELKYTLAHKLYEREQMAQGLSYDDAHDFALAYQRRLRRKDGVAEFMRG